MRPHRWQPTRLPRPWDFPGKNTGVGCHFLLQCMKVKSESEVTQSCPTVCNPMDCSLPGSSVRGILQARVLEWGAIAFSTDWTTHAFFPVISKRVFVVLYTCDLSTLVEGLQCLQGCHGHSGSRGACSLKTLGQCGSELTPFCHPPASLDYPTAIRMILASSWYYPLHRQGKVSYFLIPWGERQLLSQCPKIACHSQLPDWRPSRGTQKQHESTARVSGTPLKHQLRAASQEDPACSEAFLLFF